MEPHRPTRYESDAEGSTERGPRRKRADALPLDVHWLEREALRYVARAEATQQGVESMLERKLLERCERTGESPSEVERLIPDVARALAGIAAAAAGSLVLVGIVSVGWERQALAANDEIREGGIDQLTPLAIEL